MTVIKGIGISIDKIYLSGNKNSEFVELSKIKEIIIFERLTPYTIYMNLAIIPNKLTGELKLIFEVTILYKLT